MAFSKNVKELLSETSDLTQAIGRRIGSPKNDPNDLYELEAAVAHVQETLGIIRSTVIESYPK